MINIKVRMKSKEFWITMIPAVLLGIQLVAKLFDVELDFSGKEEIALDIINVIFVILSACGIIIDPTTAGIGDSAQALLYETPRNGEAVEDEADGIGTTKFTKRTTKPATNNKWYYKSNPFYQCGYGLPNCTAWAWARFSEILGAAANLCRSNAENWYKYGDGYKRGKTPKLGAVIVWAKGAVGNESDGAGHVAVVEEIYPDGSFMVSESGWGCKSIMWTTVIPKSCKRSGYTFLGFIYNPAVTDTSVTKKKTTKYKVGGTYTLQAAIKVRAGAGTGKEWLKRSQLTEDAKKHAQSGEYAVLKKGTKVTCQKLKGDWMKIPSGWICCKSGSEVYIK